MATLQVAAVLLVSLTSSACSEPRSSGENTAAGAASFRPIDQPTLDATVARVAAPLRAPGAVVLLRTPAGTLTTTYGTRTLGRGPAITVDDHFRIGSNTKTFTTTAILQLAQERKLSIEDVVSNYRTEVPGGDRITIAQLLGMRSGLANYSDTPELNEALDKHPTKVWKQDELLALALAKPIEAPPGRKYFYTNTNTILLGLIAERLDATPLARIFQDRFFTPYELNATSFPDIAANAVPAPHPRGYMYGSNVETLQPLRTERRAAAAAGTFLPDDVTDENYG